MFTEYISYEEQKEKRAEVLIHIKACRYVAEWVTVRVCECEVQCMHILYMRVCRIEARCSNEDRKKGGVQINRQIYTNVCAIGNRIRESCTGRKAAILKQ